METPSTKRYPREWTQETYCAAVTELEKYSKTKRLNKQHCSASWQVDKHGRLVRTQPPHQILLPLEPIVNDKGGFLVGLDLGAAERIRNVHAELLHAGAFKVHQHLTKTLNYFVPRRLVEKTLVNRCETCMRQRVQKVATPIVPVRAFWPMQRVQLDFMDCRGKHVAFPRKMQPGNWDRGNKSKSEYKIDYVLVAVCVFSGYAWYRPLYCNSQWEVCFEITKLFNEFGWPQILHTDNGTPFHSKMLASLCRDHDVFLVHGRPYHPQSQGKVERLNRTLKTMARKMQEDVPGQPWLQYLARAVFVYNRTPHSKTGLAPFVAFYGRKPTEPMTYRGEWEMNEVERESHAIVLGRKKYCSEPGGAQDDLLAYVKQLSEPPHEQDEVDRRALFTYLTEQQPLLLAQVTALQGHQNALMVKRSIRQQGKLKPVHSGDRVLFSRLSSLGNQTTAAQRLAVGNVVDVHVGGIMQTYTIQEDNGTIHHRVHREHWDWHPWLHSHRVNERLCSQQHCSASRKVCAPTCAST